MTLDPWELETRFRELVAPRVFRRGRSSERPLTLWVGGQPGSGKTFCGEALLRRLGLPDVCPIIGDDLRRFHPEFDELVSMRWSPERCAGVRDVFDRAFARNPRFDEAARIVAVQPLIAAAHEHAGIADPGAVEAQRWLYGVALRLQQQFKASPQIAGIELRPPAARAMIDVLHERAAARSANPPAADRGQRGLEIER